MILWRNIQVHSPVILEAYYFHVWVSRNWAAPMFAIGFPSPNLQDPMPSCCCICTKALALVKDLSDGKVRRSKPTLFVGVSIVMGAPKWMVYFMENPTKWDDN